MAIKFLSTGLLYVLSVRLWFLFGLPYNVLLKQISTIYSDMLIRNNIFKTNEILIFRDFVILLVKGKTSFYL